MITNVRDDKKRVEIWLTREEGRDEALRESLKPLYAAYKQKKYLVVVFTSGEGSLAEYTSALLRHNRDKMAREEVKAEQAARDAVRRTGDPGVARTGDAR